MHNQTGLHNQFSLAEKTAEIVENIVEPLFKCFQMNHFSYVKFFADGKVLRLSTSNSWTQKYMELGLFNEVNYNHPQIQNIVMNGDQSFLKVGMPRGKFNQALYEHDIWNSLTIAKRETNAVETWCFGTKRDNEKMLDFYLNNMRILNHFILYFMEKTHDIITSCRTEDLIVTQGLRAESSQSENESVRQFLAQTSIKRFWIGDQEYLSRREVECLQYLLRGQSLKSIAQLLNISIRTVETHINNIKRKLGCNYKSELLNKIAASKLSDWLDDIT